MFEQLRLAMAKRSCQTVVTQSIELMEAHKEQGLPAGHRFYGILWERADAAITSVICRAEAAGEKTSRMEIEAGMPKLQELYKLSSGSSKGLELGTVLGVCISSLIALTTAITIVAFEHGWYVHITHWMHL